MNRAAVGKKLGTAKESILENAGWIAEEVGVDGALVDAVVRAKGKGETLLANQMGAMAELIGAIAAKMGKESGVRSPESGGESEGAADAAETSPRGGAAPPSKGENEEAGEALGRTPKSEKPAKTPKGK